MSVLGREEEDRVNLQQEQNRVRYLRCWGMVMIGMVLGMAMGVFVYSVVRHGERMDGKDVEGGMEWDYWVGESWEVGGGYMEKRVLFG
jgi:hypothetical protein